MKQLRMTYVALTACAGFALLSLAGSRAEAVPLLYNGHWYGLTSSATNWTSAEAEAVTKGGHLAAINTSVEQGFLNANFLPQPAGSVLGLPRWIGLNDAASEGTFVWSNGDPLGYTNWKGGEPNNTPPSENYVAIDWERSLSIPAPIGTWNDTPLAGSTGYGGNSDGPYFGIIEVPNLAPISVAGGPYSLSLGSTLTLNGGGSSEPNSAIGDSISLYEWDLNGDLTPDFNSASPVLNLSSAQYSSFFAAPGVFSISLRVTDLAGITTTSSVLLNAFGAPVSNSGSPEPATGALMLLGLVLQRFRRRASRVSR